MEKSTPQLTAQSTADIAQMSESFSEISDKVFETTAELSQTAMSTIKKYPLHTAMVAGVVGFLVGSLFAAKK